MKKLISPRKLILYVFALVILLSIQYINKPSLSQENIVAVMTGVDKIDDGYEVSLKYLSPSSAKNEHSSQEKFLVGRGENVALAIQNVCMQTGKTIGLSHCSTIVLSDSIVDIDINLIADYFLRTKKVGKNTIIVHGGSSAKDFVKASIYLANNFGIKIIDVAEKGEKDFYTSFSTIESFYKGFFSPTKISTMPSYFISDESLGGIEVKIVSEPTGEIIETDLPKKYFNNKGDTLVIKNGKKLLTLNKDQSSSMNLMLKNKQKGEVTVQNVNDAHFKNATLVLEIIGKKTKISGNVSEDKLTYNLSLDIKVRLEQIVSNELSNQNVDELKSTIQEGVKTATKNEIETRLTELFNLAKDNKIDIIEGYKYFNANHYKNFKKILAKCENPNDFLALTDFKVNVTVQAGT